MPSYYLCRHYVSSVIPARFERATHSLEGCCSIQLSYGTGNYKFRVLSMVFVFKKSFIPDCLLYCDNQKYRACV